jgi:hypothetical protein
MVGNCAKSVFGFYVESDKGINLSVDLDTTPRELAQNYRSLVQIGSDETWRVASKGEFKIGDILEDAQLKASVKSGYMKEVAMKEDIGSGDKSPVYGRARLKTSIKNEKPIEVAMEEDIDCGDNSPVHGGSQLTRRSDKHETEPPKRVTTFCNGKPPDSCQVSTDYSLAGLKPSSLASVISPNHLHYYYYFALDCAISFLLLSYFYMCFGISLSFSYVQQLVGHRN